VRIGPLLAAMALHGLALALLVWKLGSAPQVAAVPVMNVELARRPATPRPRRSRSERRGTAPAGLSQAAPRRESASAAEDGSPPDGTGGAAAAPAVRPVLRGLLGCRNADLAQLTTDEREHCLEQLAKMGGPLGRTIDLDPHGRFATDPTPYLARKPKQGCKISAAGDVDPGGKQGPAAGVTCSWAF
jgi:hypothetical protein